MLIDSSTRVICQGITGYLGRFFTHQAMEYGTNVVAGVSPGHAGEKCLNLPVYDTVREARENTNAQATMLFVPPRVAGDAILEAIEAGVELIVCVTEGIPVLDLIRIKERLKNSDCRLIGPNCPGIIKPGACKIGIMPSSVYMEGNIAVVSRSGTLFYEAVTQLCAEGLGQSTCIGIGADPVHGLSFTECLELFRDDPATHAVLLIGEIGGEAEEQAAQYLAANPYPKPVVAFIAGRHAPTDRRMGHAGAIISAGLGGTDRKIEMLKASGVTIPDSLVTIGRTVRQALRS